MAGTSIYPYSPTVKHTVLINSDLMTPRNGGVNYPDYLTLAFNQAAPSPNPDQTSRQWDALTAVRRTLGQAPGLPARSIRIPPVDRSPRTSGRTR